MASPLASAEMGIIAELLRGHRQGSANITVRGVEPDAFLLRPQLKIVEGRIFTTGLRELIVGRGWRASSGAELGSTFACAAPDWTVVGVFRVR